MRKKILNDCVVTIENYRNKKTLFIEELTDDNGKVIEYKVKKIIEPKNIKNPNAQLPTLSSGDNIGKAN